jgi:hypothetical protein
LATLSSKTGLPSFLSTSAQAGEKNYITNPSAKLVITGWYASSADLTVARTTTAGDLPREHTTAAGVKILSTAAADSTNDYVYYDFTLDDVDLNKKLAIKWSQKQTGSYVAGDLAVVITTQAARGTTLHTPVTTAIPASDGDFVTTFDSGSTATLSLVIKATTNMADSAGITISDVVVGPGTITQGAAVSEWQTLTPSTTQGFGTIASSSLQYRRVGSSIEVQGRFTPTSAASQARLGLPSGLTITHGGLDTPVGRWTINNASGSSRKTGPLWAATGETYVHFGSDDYTTATAPTGNNNGDVIAPSNQIVFVQFSVPIAEWAGNGTVNLGAGAQQEWAFSTNTTTTAGNTQTDDGLYGYGPGGTSIVACASSTASSNTTKRVRFQYPIQSDDLIILEVNQGSAGDPWMPVDQVGLSGQYQARVIYGVKWQRVSGSTTDIYVQFGNGGATPNSGSAQVYETTNVDPWSGYTAWKWRVRKAKASSPVGFGMVTADSSGLLRSYSSLTRLRLNTQGGYGSTNTAILRFTNTTVNTGTGITYADSATLGASFTCTESGIYAFSYSSCFNAATAVFGLSLNSSQLTTSIVSITAADRLASSAVSHSNLLYSVAWTGYLAAGDIVRPHSDTSPAGTSTAGAVFSCQRIA